MNTNQGIDRQREIFFEELKLGSLTVELSVQKEANYYFDNACSVYLVAKDENSRRLWSTPIIDDQLGGVKIYASVNEAISDVKKKLGLYFEQ